jgi:hypothetical protein
MTELTDKQKAFVATVPEKSRVLISRALVGTVSPRQCIKAKCLDCCCYNRAEAAACTVTLCPLWAVNPYRLGAMRGKEVDDE